MGRPKRPKRPPKKPRLRVVPTPRPDPEMPSNVVEIAPSLDPETALRLATAKVERAGASLSQRAATERAAMRRFNKAIDALEARASSVPAVVEAPAPAPAVVTRKRTSAAVVLLQLAGIGVAIWAVAELVKGHVEAKKIAAANPATHEHHHHRHHHETHASYYPTHYEHVIDTHVVERAKPGPRGPSGRPGRDGRPGRQGPKGDRGERGRNGRDASDGAALYKQARAALRPGTA